MKASEIRFLTVAEVLRGHSFALAETAGEEWIRHIERLAAGELSRDELTGLFTAAMGGDPVAIE